MFSRIRATAKQLKCFFYLPNRFLLGHSCVGYGIISYRKCTTKIYINKVTM